MHPVRHVSNDRPIYHRRCTSFRCVSYVPYHHRRGWAQYILLDNVGDQWFFELRLQLNGISEMHIFFWKERYIKVIHHLETFLTSAQTAHYLKQFRKDPDTLMTVNPKTRPPVMCPRKKVHGHLCQKMRCRYKYVLQIRLLKDSPRMEPVCSRENNLQKRSLFGIKKTQGCRTQKY